MKCVKDPSVYCKRFIDAAWGMVDMQVRFKGTVDPFALSVITPRVKMATIPIVSATTDFGVVLSAIAQENEDVDMIVFVTSTPYSVSMSWKTRTGEYGIQCRVINGGPTDEFDATIHNQVMQRVFEQVQ